MANIPLRIVDGFPPIWTGDRQPGMMWRDPRYDDAGRECWWIVLPNSRPGEGATEITWRTTDRASAPPHEMWNVTGTPPLITVTPSVDVEFWTREGVRDGSYWHGFITNGELVG
jgi:hypothetical protein